MNKRDHAIALAKKGFRVFPCEPNGKKPVWPVRLGKETSDVAKVREIWTEAVTGESLDYNIGVATDDLFVFDIDNKDGTDVHSRWAELNDRFSKEQFTAGVITPSGGLHFYTRLAQGQRASNSAKTKFGQGIDTRSWHGYVLAPGSTIDGTAYAWLTSERDNLKEPTSITDLPETPQAVIEIAGRPIDREHQAADVVWDEPSALSAANAFIRHAAPAIQGNGGNDHTYRIAARLRQFGVSADTALDIMLDWNAKCEPPWQLEELSRVIDNAYTYATAAPTTPGAEFSSYDMPEIYKSPDLSAPIYTSPDWPTPEIEEPYDIDALPKRKWLVPGLLAKTYVTALIAPSGAGKTQFMLQMLLALSSGKPGLISNQPLNPCSVWMWNQEDDKTELRRRMGAAIRYFGIDWPELSQKLYINSGVNKALLLVARDATGHLRETKRVSAIIRHMIDNGIQALIIDPLIEFHEADENNNVEMRIVAATLRRIAVEAKAAVMVGHHTKKPDGARSDGFAGNADSGRGASSIQGVTRIMATLYAMTEADAKKLKIKPEDRWKYVRLDGAKSNISSSSSGTRPEWFERKGQEIGKEGDTEEVGILAPIDLIGSRVLREAEAAHEKLSGEAEATGRPQPAFAEAHPYAVALADTLEGQGVEQGKRVPVSAYREAAARSIGELTARDNRFGKWCIAQVGEPMAAGKGRALTFYPATAAGASSRISWEGGQTNYLD